MGIMTSHRSRCLPGTTSLPVEMHYLNRAYRRSVIVSVRGTWSMEDIITDSVADPMLLKDWLPKGDTSCRLFCSKLQGSIYVILVAQLPLRSFMISSLHGLS